jgi:hypothetical protein
VIDIDRFAGLLKPADLSALTAVWDTILSGAERRRKAKTG